MFEFLLKRLASVVPTLILVSVLIFGLQQLLPGDPAMVLAGEEQDPAVVAYLRVKLHLDKPLPVRYGYWVAGVLKGDLGESIRSQEPVLTLVLQKLPVTVELALLAFAIALLIGIPAGVVSAVGRGTAWDALANGFSLWGISTPNFWLGILLIMLFSVQLGWLPASGYVSPFVDLRANLAAMIMPAFVLGNGIAGVLMRHTRSAMLQVMSADYVRTARAKGLSERVVVLKHALRNALTPIITLGALELGTLLSGAVLTEQVFTIPGFGKLVVDSVFNRDYAVVGCRSRHRVGLHHAEPAGRLGLLCGESETEVLMNAIAMPTSPKQAAKREAGPWRRALRKLTRRRSALFGAAVVLGFVVLAIFAGWIAPLDPIATSWGDIRKAPSAAHWFGTDELGRDVLSRVIWGTQASLLAGMVSVSIALMLGVPIGLAAGFLGGAVDLVISRITDAFLACPFLILAIAMAAFLGPSLTNAMIAIGVSATPIFVRLTRAQVINVKVEDYVEAARAVGNPPWRIALRHVLPNVTAPLIVQATLSVAAAVIAEASLSFLGLGQQPPAPSWGSMLNTAKNYIDNAPWMAIWPGLSIFLLVLAFNLLGDGLRDALDPRQR